MVNISHILFYILIVCDVIKQNESEYCYWDTVKQSR